MKPTLASAAGEILVQCEKGYCSRWD